MLDGMILLDAGTKVVSYTWGWTWGGFIIGLLKINHQMNNQIDKPVANTINSVIISQSPLKIYPQERYNLLCENKQYKHQLR